VSAAIQGRGERRIERSCDEPQQAGEHDRCVRAGERDSQALSTRGEPCIGGVDEGHRADPEPPEPRPVHLSADSLGRERMAGLVNEQGQREHRDQRSRAGRSFWTGGSRTSPSAPRCGPIPLTSFSSRASSRGAVPAPRRSAFSPIVPFPPPSPYGAVTLCNRRDVPIFVVQPPCRCRQADIRDVILLTHSPARLRSASSSTIVISRLPRSTSPRPARPRRIWFTL
jgi:hypothetical protein